MHGNSARRYCDPPWSSSAHSDPGHNRPWQYPYQPIRVLLGGSWKAKQLWDKLDHRAAQPEYAEAPCASGRLCDRKVVVVGAGPCGLRAAIECRLLGAQVVVVERRREFSRMNQLHLWNWCGEDIKALGARCIEPPPADFGANPDKLNIGIAELQLLLLKTALLFGAQVFLATDFQELVTPEKARGTWGVRLGVDGDAPESCPSPLAPTLLQGVGAVVGSDGLACGIGRHVGIKHTDVGSLRAEDAIGLVCNFAPILSSSREKELRSFSLARQFYTSLFHDLAKCTGADLENIVYVKSKASHYFVMTPTRACLLASGVVRDACHKPLLSTGNINRQSLDDFVRRVITFRFKDGEPSLEDVASCARESLANGGTTLRYADGGPQLFDFSKLSRADTGLVFVDRPACERLAPSHVGEAVDNDGALPVFLVGDSLLEPFWPEGLGIVRGFFSVLDAGFALARWSGGAGRRSVEREYAESYAQLKSLGAGTRAAILRGDESRYSLAPHSRYRALRVRTETGAVVRNDASTCTYTI